LGINVDERYRNIAGIAMKFANIQTLDIRDVDHKGLANVSKMEQMIVSLFQSIFSVQRRFIKRHNSLL
jgi:hypothetical protein